MYAETARGAHAVRLEADEGGREFARASLWPEADHFAAHVARVRMTLDTRMEGVSGSSTAHL